MTIKCNEQGYVEGYAEVGGMPGAVEYAGAIPEGFGPDTCRYYRLEGGALVYDAAKRQAELDAISAAAELAERLEELVATPDRRAALGQACRERAQRRFSWEAAGHTILEVYGSLL